MHVQIAKWGNSLGLRLPRALADEVGVTAGERVEITAEAGVLVVRPLRPRWTLVDLLTNMTPDAMAQAFDWGDGAGRGRIDD